MSGLQSLPHNSYYFYTQQRFHGHNLSSFELPDIDYNSLPQSVEASVTDSIDEAHILAMVESANEAQKAIIDNIMALARQNDISKTNAYFIYGLSLIHI